MEKAKLKKLYEFILNNGVLSRQKLLQVGFLTEDIQEFFNNGILSIKGQNVKFIDVNGLYEYGINLSIAGMERRANECFKICAKIAPSFEGDSFQNFLIALTGNDNEKANELFQELSQLEPKISEQDLNLYLFLISYVMDLSEEHKVCVSEMTLDDVLISDEKNITKNEENIIRKLIFDGRLLLAMSKLNNAKNINNHYFFKSLLSLAIISETKLDKRIHTLIKNKQYSEIGQILLEIRKKRNLKTSHTYILILVMAILKLEDGEPIQKTDCENNVDFYFALTSGNYELALKIYEEYLTSKKGNKKEDPVYMLLVDIIFLINTLPENKIVTESEDIARKRVKAEQ